MASNNGGNNPPIPIGGGATGAMFQGTDQTPIPLSAIAAPAAPTVAEAAPHAGVLNTLDPYFYQQFVALSNFTWATSQAPGTLLWSSPITPTRAHVNLQYLARMYNIWVGGLDYQVKVAGTGFHAGAIAIVRLPPNINPSKISSVQQFTMFEYTVIDPKTLEAMSKSVCDQRPIHYHYVNDDIELPNSIGGYLAIYVLIQLNTSSTGTAQIDLQVFNKASLDFALLQIVPVTLPELAPPAPTFFDTLWDAAGSQLDPYTLDNIEDVFIQVKNPPPTEVRLEDRSCGLVSMRTGEYIGEPIVQSSDALDIFTTGPTSGYFCNSTGTRTPKNFLLSTRVVYNAVAKDSASNTTYLLTLNGNGALDMTTTGFTQAGSQVNFASGRRLNVNYLIPRDFIQSANAYKAVPPVRDECFIGFRANVEFIAFQPASTSVQTTSVALTTTTISGILANTTYRMPFGQCALLQVVDREFNLPVLFIKMYKEGYFAAASVATNISVRLADYRLQFVGYLRETDPIPGQTSAMQQTLLTRQMQYQYERLSRMQISDGSSSSSSSSGH